MQTYSVGTATCLIISRRTLYKILGKIIGSLYGHNLGHCEYSTASTTGQIFKLQQELNGWCYMLPASLSLISRNGIPQVAEENPDTADLQRCRIIITLRYLNTQLLLHRPLLTQALSQSPSDSPQHRRLSDQTGQNITQCCTGFAERIITLIHGVLTNKKLGKSFLGSWWFTIYYSKCHHRQPSKSSLPLTLL